MGLVVVKVGGSLFDLPDLGPRLAVWLGRRRERAVDRLPVATHYLYCVGSQPLIYPVGSQAFPSPPAS